MKKINTYISEKLIISKDAFDEDDLHKSLKYEDYYKYVNYISSNKYNFTLKKDGCWTYVYKYINANLVYMIIAYSKTEHDNDNIVQKIQEISVIDEHGGIDRGKIIIYRDHKKNLIDYPDNLDRKDNGSILPTKYNIDKIFTAFKEYK